MASGFKVTNERQTITVENLSTNLRLTGEATFSPSDEVNNFSGSINLIKEAGTETITFNGSFYYNEQQGIVDTDNQNGVPVQYSAETSSLVHNTVSEIKEFYANKQVL